MKKKLALYKPNWLNRVRRMEGIRDPTQVLAYRPIGRIRAE